MIGTVVEIHAITEEIYKYGGSYGLIRGEDGKIYVYSGSHVYRDMSHLTVGRASRSRCCEAMPQRSPRRDTGQRERTTTADRSDHTTSSSRSKL